MINFKPDYEFIVGRPSKLNNYVIPRGLVSPQKLSQGVNGVDANGFRFSTSPDGTTLKSGDYLDYNTTPADFRSITKLQIKANIPETEDTSVRVVFEITNLSEELKDFIRVDDTVCFRAEYTSKLPEGETTLPDVFIGQVQRVKSSFNGTDRITTIECSSGQTLRRNSRISYNWAPNATRLTVLKTIMAMLSTQGLPTGYFKLPTLGSRADQILKAKYLTGYSIQGKTFEEFNKVLDACKMVGFISKGKLFVRPKQYSVDKSQNTLIKPYYVVSSGMIKGQPEEVEGEATSEPSGGGEGTKDISLTLYFDSRIGLDSEVILDDTVVGYEGEYKVSSSRYIYDHRGGVYEVKVVLTGVTSE